MELLITSFTNVDGYAPMNTSVLEPLEHPLLCMAAALELTEQGTPVPQNLEQDLREMPYPWFTKPSDAGQLLWSILNQPERVRGLTWLDEHGILDELIPAWEGNVVRKTLRLNAVEQLNREVWKQGLDEAVFNMIRDIHDTVVDRRINRWALTALGILLASGDMEDPRTWASFVRRDLHALGATEAELVWVTGILLNINPTLLFLAGEDIAVAMRPELAVVGLCTLSVSDPDKMAVAVERVNDSLENSVNPLDRVPEEED